MQTISINSRNSLGADKNVGTEIYAPNLPAIKCEENYGGNNKDGKMLNYAN